MNAGAVSGEEKQWLDVTATSVLSVLGMDLMDNDRGCANEISVSNTADSDQSHLLEVLG